jgi:hypothetical protein
MRQKLGQWTSELKRGITERLSTTAWWPWLCRLMTTAASLEGLASRICTASSRAYVSDSLAPYSDWPGCCTRDRRLVQRHGLCAIPAHHRCCVGDCGVAQPVEEAGAAACLASAYHTGPPSLPTQALLHPNSASLSNTFKAFESSWTSARHTTSQFRVRFSSILTWL